MVVWVDAFLNSTLKPGPLLRPLRAATVGVSTSINYALSAESKNQWSFAGCVADPKSVWITDT